ncbi:hypothetical protein D3C71_2131860 [compost metagenome]
MPGRIAPGMFTQRVGDRAGRSRLEVQLGADFVRAAHAEGRMGPAQRDKLFHIRYLTRQSGAALPIQPVNLYR